MSFVSGCISAHLLARFLSSLLVEIDPNETKVYAAVLLTLIASTFAACGRPLTKALSRQTAEILRCD